MKYFCISLAFFLVIFLNIGISQESKYRNIEQTVYEGSTEVDSIFSPALEGNLQGNPSTQPVKVYLPPNYHNFPENKYPVVYLLHPGAGQDYNHFYSKRNLFNKLNQLISAKAIAPMIIVCPNANTVYGGSCYTNSFVSGNWEDYIVKDVVTFIEREYLVMDQAEHRGLAGFSIGGYGTIKIAMKNPSIFKSIGLIGPGVLNFEEEMINTQSWREARIAAAGMEGYDPDEENWKIRESFAHAVAWAPDSSAPVLGQFPFTPDGVLIDSVWQRYLMHDPTTMLNTYADSLLILDSIQFYLGEDDEAASYGCIPFHQSLIDNDIAHGYISYSGGHDPEPVIEDLLVYFSESLFSTVPTVKARNYNHTREDTLYISSDKSGVLYIVPINVYPSIDSIIKYQITSIDITKNKEKVIILSGYDTGEYLVFLVSNENTVSNVPAEFIVTETNSINNKIYLPEIFLYPNPATEAIELFTNIDSTFEITITAINGQQMLLGSFMGTHHILDLSPFQKGVYFITLRSNNNHITKILVKL